MAIDINGHHDHNRAHTMERNSEKSRQDKPRRRVNWLGKLFGLIDAVALRPYDPGTRNESYWKVDTGEGNGIAAGSSLTEGFNVREALRSPEAQAAFKAQVAVDRDPTIPAARREGEFADRYEAILAEERSSTASIVEQGATDKVTSEVPQPPQG